MIKNPGSWIMVTKVPNTVIKPRALSLYFAVTEKIFPYGSFDLAFNYYDDENFQHYSRIFRGARSVGDQNFLLMYKNWLLGDLDKLPDIYIDRFEKLKNIDFRFEERVRITTEDGEVCLEPHEYTIVKDINEYIEYVDNEHLSLCFLGGDQSNKEFDEKMFYIQSRGVDKVTAYGLLLGDIEAPNIMCLHWHDEYLRMFGKAA